MWKAVIQIARSHLILPAIPASCCWMTTAWQGTIKMSNQLIKESSCPPVYGGKQGRAIIPRIAGPPSLADRAPVLGLLVHSVKP